MSCASTSISSYDPGQLVILKNGTFLDADSTAVDPPEVICKVRDPLGVTVEYEFGVASALEKLATGRYRLTIKPLTQGLWRYGWLAVDTTNPIEAALEGAQLQGQFIVRGDPFA